MSSNIARIEFTEEEIEMCDITVDDVHCYYANGILTHNCAQELRLPANLTLDQSFCHAFLTGGDPHESTAIQMFGEESYDKEKRKIAKCVTGDTMIPFSGRGLVRIDALYKGEADDTFTPCNVVVQDDGAYRKVKCFYYGGVVGTIRLITDKGYEIEGTPVHPMWVPDGRFKKLSEFSIGDKISVAKAEAVEAWDYLYTRVNCWGSRVTENSSEVKLTPEYAELCGLLVGDGTINSKACYLMWSDKFSDLTEKYKNLLDSLGIDGRVEYNVGRGSTKLNQITIGSTRFVRFLSSLGVFDGSHKVLRIPEWVFMSPISVRAAFLRGLFETDGSVSITKGNEYVEFCSRSKRLCQDVQLLLSSIGIMSIVRGSYNKVYDRTYYKTRVYKSQLSKFKVVGFISDEKQAKFDSISNLLSREQSKIYEATVVDIQYSEAPVYDLTVEDSHRFTANGLLSSNTFNFGILYGMSTYSVAERYKIPLETAEKWVSLYKSAHRQVFTWVDAITKKAKKEGTVYNYFHRPRRVKYYLQSPDPKMRSFGYRTVVNTSIQSVGADMTKLALCRLWSDILDDSQYIEYDEDGKIAHRKVKFTATIHDETNLTVDKDIAREVIAKHIKCQRLKIKGFPVPFDVGLEVGNRWGECFPFKINQETGEVLEPEGDFVNQQEPEVEETEAVVDDVLDEVSFDEFE